MRATERTYTGPRRRLGAWRAGRPGEVVGQGALKRAALFGRAPVADDLEMAFGLFGFLDEPLVGPALEERRRLFAEASHHHHYTEVRRIVDLVPDATLGLTRQEALDTRDAGRAFTP